MLLEIQKMKFLEFEINFLTVITANIANCLHDFPFFGYNNRARK